ncbi:MAG: ABC transporter ATP-binding protein [Thermoplasmata archaeon]|nr:ABC transporter ATP-binding protein [Thermoplasmata archaeon]
MSLHVSNLCFSYGKQENLNEISLDLEESEILGILGPNGSGKTTLIRCISRILQPKSGSVILDGEDVYKMSRNEIAKNIGFVPQNSMQDQNPPTVYEVVLMGRRPYIYWNYTERDKDIVWSAMREMKVDEFAMRPFNKLSSGQAQRVLIARAIAQEAKIIMLDEPTSNLDVKYQIEVLETIHKTVKDKNLSACLIIHDLDLAMRFCDKVLLMKDGKSFAFGETSETLSSENISAIFGINCVIDNNYGRSRIIILD